MNLQATFDIPEICYQLGIRKAVISPGSRNGALTIAFSQHKGIACYSVPDERSAAFIALGMSMSDDIPTVLICTSGSAGLNYYPAIAEAYFNRIPLLILTADRPEELVGIRDGQTIYQPKMYGKHIKAAFEFPSDHELTSAHKITEEAIALSMTGIKGPVHINIPYEEPFYPEEILSPSNLEVDRSEKTPQQSKLDLELSKYSKILIVIGQGAFDSELIQSVSSVATEHHIPIIADVVGNAQELPELIVHHDMILKNPTDDLAPDLLVTFGLSVLSKNLKKFLRSADLEHWHIDMHGDSVDTYGKNVKSLEIPAAEFFEEFQRHQVKEAQNLFHKLWLEENEKIANKFSKLTFNSLTDVNAYQALLSAIPNYVDLHIANSMAVRYVNYFGLKKTKGIKVYCNRGTSGIDGSNSTAVGTAIASGRPTLLLTGDVAFLYDRNAFWHNHVPDNLKIIVINNGGGGIFRLIPGPSAHKELEPFFETDQKSSAAHVCSEFGIEYSKVELMKDLNSRIESFFSTDGKALLEIFTDKKENEKAFRQMFNYCS